LARSKKKSDIGEAVEAAPKLEVSKKGETMYKVGVNTFKNKYYAEKFASRKGLKVEQITV